jgi:RNA polymerase sigma-70 factor (ECF subfamily)
MPTVNEVMPLLADRDEVNRVRSVLAMGGVPWDELNDAMQQVHLKLLEAEGRPGDAEIRNPRAWLAAVASRVAIDWHRERGKTMRLQDRLTEAWETQAGDDQRVGHRLVALAVAGYLEQLDSQVRQVVVLRYFVDLSVREIAAELKIPEGTVKSRIHGAMRKLRAVLNSQEVSLHDFEQ